jgi:uncharacterized ion transporter superfamily protein YfcC
MEKQKRRQTPHIFVIIFTITIIVAALTYIIPAGEFDRVQVGKYKEVVAGSYHRVEQNGQTPWDVIKAVVTGFQQGSKLIFMVMFCGAAVHMLEKSGTIERGFKSLVGKVQGKEWIAIFAVMLAMSMGGATGVFGNPTVAIIPIGIMLSRSMGYDDTLGFAMIFFGAFSGFNVGWANVVTVGLAQSIAGIPLLSGFGVRVIFHIVNFILSFGFVMIYANKIKNDPTKSLNYEPGMKPEEYMGLPVSADDEEQSHLTTGNIISLAIMVIGFTTLIFCSIKYGWALEDYSAIFLSMAILIGLVNGFGVNGTAKEFAIGCQKMVAAAFIVGIARSISVVMTDGKIIDTIVNALVIPIDKFGPVVGANLMLLANIIINFFISSGSGQATTVMPIMTPISQLTGISRQVAVQAFQFGDGFTNCMIPTVGSLMGGLGMAKIAYNKYLKWFTPLLIVQLVLSFVAITILQIMQWGPM